MVDTSEIMLLLYRPIVARNSARFAYFWVIPARLPSILRETGKPLKCFVWGISLCYSNDSPDWMIFDDVIEVSLKISIYGWWIMGVPTSPRETKRVAILKTNPRYQLWKAPLLCVSTHCQWNMVNLETILLLTICRLFGILKSYQAFWRYISPYPEVHGCTHDRTTWETPMSSDFCFENDVI